MNDHPIWTVLDLLAAPWRWIVSEEEDWLSRFLGYQPTKPMTVTCPHCRTENDLYLLTDCRCGTREYGSRLKCTGCGTTWKSFNCDHPDCGATIYVK